AQRYFDVFVEYAKGGPDDMLIRITIENRGADPAPLHILPTLWFRNTWSWGEVQGSVKTKPSLRKLDERTISALHETLGNFRFELDRDVPQLFTENETNTERLYSVPNVSG